MSNVNGHMDAQRRLAALVVAAEDVVGRAKRHVLPYGAGELQMHLENLARTLAAARTQDGACSRHPGQKQCCHCSEPCGNYPNCEATPGWSAAREEAPAGTRTEDALRLILPLAKGYAAEHPVGSNQQYVEEAEAALANAPAQATCATCKDTGEVQCDCNVSGCTKTCPNCGGSQ